MRWKHKTFDRSEWHKWFAWYPVVIDGENVWLETVERRACFSQPYPDDTIYEYRDRESSFCP